jgi:hypothetical protein
MPARTASDNSGQAAAFPAAVNIKEQEIVTSGRGFEEVTNEFMMMSGLL